MTLCLKSVNGVLRCLFISTELQEVMSLSDRIIVLFNGEIMGEVEGDNADVSTIGRMMLGQTSEVIHE